MGGQTISYIFNCWGNCSFIEFIAFMKNLKCVMWSLRALIGRLRPSNKSMVIRVNEAGTLPSLIASHLKYRIVEPYTDRGIKWHGPKIHSRDERV